jgi:hypothetical protein
LLRSLFPSLLLQCQGELPAHPSERKDSPIVNMMCASENIWMVILKQLLSFQDH